MRVIAVSIWEQNADASLTRSLEFEYRPTTLTTAQAEDLRPKIDFALATLRMARENCDALLAVTAETRARAHRDHMEESAT